MIGAAFEFASPKKAVKPYSISEINQGVGAILEAGNTLVWVEGEISNYKRASSGHCYLKLKDAQCQVPAVIWKNVADTMDFEPEDGMQVIVIASLRVYTRGALHIAFEKLKTKLEAEGLFDPARKRPLPQHVSRLGVITSKQGAAIKDIAKVAFSRSARIDIVLIDVPVQGKTAAIAIARAIRDMNVYGKVDCMIVGRGGGSIEDLWAFNEEVVARAIYESSIPVISAVGHEIDFTISDFVADVRAATPSSAAQMAVTDDEQDRRYFLARANYLVKRFLHIRSDAQNRYAMLLRRPGLSKVASLVREARQTSDGLGLALYRGFSHVFNNFKQRSRYGASRLSALSPLHTMERGYSVVADARGATIKNAAHISAGDYIDIRFFKGKARAEITSSSE
jgi:exodeoxyribonuclease VII large subunit